MDYKEQAALIRGFAYEYNKCSCITKIGGMKPEEFLLITATAITDLLARAEAAEARAEKAERERNAAVADLRLVSDCRTCGNVTPWCIENPDKCKGWKWRGKKEE